METFAAVTSVTSVTSVTLVPLPPAPAPPSAPELAVVLTLIRSSDVAEGQSAKGEDDDDEDEDALALLIEATVHGSLESKSASVFTHSLSDLHVARIIFE